MGCVASQDAAPVTPALGSSRVSGNLVSSQEIIASSALWHRPQLANYECEDQCPSDESEKMDSVHSSVSFRLWNMTRQGEAEQVAAGWPGWLSTVAGEAIQGWLPLKVESFQKLEKVGQGTYSTVFRACEIATGRIVALKKVRFDKFEPESIRFMAREIQILRRLDHPNIVKLEGLITSPLSCSIYLVFEYMEHDLAGLSSNPDIKLSESQIKCYMYQLLSGLEQCHSCGIIHRDIKCANLLVNNEGVLKIADFGLANIWNPLAKQPLTSRVVTLWYRPPELLMGSTNYEPSVDLWSVGCVFAELFHGKPILQGRTEVEQLHKIFKICGSPREEFWSNCRLPNATVFKPQQHYPNCLRETFDFLPKSVFKLFETFVSIEPSKRGTASAALNSEYFRVKPYKSHPSSLPKYHPNKEIDAKFREDSRKRSFAARSHAAEATKKPAPARRASRDMNFLYKTSSQKEASKHAQGMNKARSIRQETSAPNEGTRPMAAHRSKQMFQKDRPFSALLRAPPSACFALAKKPKESQISRAKSCTKSRSGKLDPPPCVSRTKTSSRMNAESRNVDRGLGHHNPVSGVHDSYESIKEAMLKQWVHPELHDSVYSFGHFHSRKSSEALDGQDLVQQKNRISGYGDQAPLSGPLLLQPEKVEEFLQRHERRVQQAVRKPWLQREQKQEQWTIE